MKKSMKHSLRIVWRLRYEPSTSRRQVTSRRIGYEIASRPEDGDVCCSVHVLTGGATQRSSSHNTSGGRAVWLGGFTLQRQPHHRWWLMDYDDLDCLNDCMSYFRATCKMRTSHTTVGIVCPLITRISFFKEMLFVQCLALISFSEHTWTLHFFLPILVCLILVLSFSFSSSFPLWRYIFCLSVVFFLSFCILLYFCFLSFVSCVYFIFSFSRFVCFCLSLVLFQYLCLLCLSPVLFVSFSFFPSSLVLECPKRTDACANEGACTLNPRNRINRTEQDIHACCGGLI